MTRVVFSILFFFFLTNLYSQTKDVDLWEKYYKKATVATFYSATILNGYDELKLAKLYVDSAENYTYGIKSRTQLIKNLRAELKLSEEIAGDNFNYIFPASSLMSGHRDEFVYMDDPNVLLIEDLVEKMLDMNDPLNKGNFRDNTDFVLTTLSPYDDEMAMVVADYLGATTGHYCIRQHEILSILSEEGIKRYHKNALIDADYDSICAFYNIDQLINLNVVDNGADIKDLSYKGIYFNYYQKGKGLKYLNYFEAFKVDKSSARSKSILVAIVNFMLAFLGLFLINSASFVRDGRGLRIGKYKLRFALNPESIRDSGLIILISLVVVIGAYYLSQALSPDINAFYQEISVKMWVAYQIVIPTILSIGITYLALFKFPKIVVNSSMGYSRILYASLLMPLTLLSFFEYEAELFPEKIVKYLDLVPFFALIWVVLLLGNLLNSVVKGTAVNFWGWVVVFFSLFAVFLGFYFELRQFFLTANICYSVIGFTSVILLYFNKNLSYLKIHKIRTEQESQLGGSNLSNPYTYFGDGYNINYLNLITDEFLNEEKDMRNVMFLGGKPGMGKTRLIKELIDQHRLEGKNGLAIFSGDCNIVKDGAAPLYEPFYEAFCLNGERACGDLDDNIRYLTNKFFTNRSQIGQGLTSVLNMAGGVAPVDISGVLSVEEDSTRSVKEIVLELTDFLIDNFIKNNVPKKILFIIDDYQNVDESTHELFLEFLKTVKLRTKFSKFFKVIVIHSQQIEGEDSEPVNKLKKDLRDVNDSLPETEVYRDGTISLNQNQFIESVINSKTFKVSEKDQGYFSFGPLLKGHLDYISRSMPNQLTPGDLFAYLETLEINQILTFDGNTIRIIREPEEGEIKIQGSRRGIIEAKFEELVDEDRKLLESASVIGFKFDAELLAQIWNKDLIEIINRLEKFEGQFVVDQSSEDNVFAFVDKVTHDVIFELAQSGTADIRQLVIEYQKRIIRSIADNKDPDFVSRIDVDILVGATERCFKYSYVKEIHSYTSILGYEAVLKLATLGKRKKALSLLKRLLEFSNRNYTDKEIYKIALILVELTKVNRSLNDFDWQIGNYNFLDDIHGQSRKKTNRYFNEKDYLSNPYIQISIVLLGGIMEKIKEKNRVLMSSQNNEQLSNPKVYDLNSLLEDIDEPLYGKRYQLISELTEGEGLLDDWSNARILFYKTIINGKEAQELPIILKSSLTAKHFELAGEIARHYSMNKDISKEQKKNALILSLQLFKKSEELDNLSLDNIVDYSPSEMMHQIREVIKSQTLGADEAKNFNMLLSRIREYFFHTCENFELTIEVCDLAVLLSNKVNDERGGELALSYKGASLYRLKQYQNSIDVYIHLFESLIRSSRDIQKFVYALEGLLMNGRAINDLTDFYKAKEELYEHLLYLGSSAINETLVHSLYDKKKRLSDLFEVNSDNKEEESSVTIEIDEKQKQTISDVLKILTGITYADGEVEEEELFDLKESAIALSYALNLTKKHVIDQIPEVCSQYNTLSKEERVELFEKTCINLKATQTKNFALSVLSLCIDMAKADGEFSDEEKNLVRIAKKVFES